MVLDSLLPPRVLIAAMEIRRASMEDLLGEERDVVLDAVPRRVREFAAGRLLSRHLLERFTGAPAAPITSRRDRSPEWPPGIVGSITHTDVLAAAAIASRAHFAGIGIDLEPAEVLPKDVVPLVMTAAERHAFGADVAERVVFSAKEAFYKAQYQVSSATLDFLDVQIQLFPGGRFTARLNRDAGPFHRNWMIEGRYAVQDRQVGTAVVIPSCCAGRSFVRPYGRSVAR